MTDEHLNPGIRIAREDLEERIGTKINGESGGYNLIVAPTEIIQVEEISLLDEKTLKSIVKAIKLRGTEIYPYQNSEVRIYSAEPRSYLVGQLFVDSRKILRILNNLDGILNNNFGIGITKVPPIKIYGQTATQEKALALLIPPLIEHHQNQGILIDGTHRSYICANLGIPIRGIHIYDINSPPPFIPAKWEEVKQVEIKPPKEQRYKQLIPELFRDLSFVGVDG